MLCWKVPVTQCDIVVIFDCQLYVIRILPSATFWFGVSLSPNVHLARFASLCYSENINSLSGSCNKKFQTCESVSTQHGRDEAMPLNPQAEQNLSAHPSDQHQGLRASIPPSFHLSQTTIYQGQDQGHHECARQF